MKIIAIISMVVALAIIGCQTPDKAKPNLSGVKVFGKDNDPYAAYMVTGLLNCGAVPAPNAESADLVVSYELLDKPKRDSYLVVVRDHRGSVLMSFMPEGFPSHVVDDEAIEFAESYHQGSTSQTSHK